MSASDSPYFGKPPRQFWKNEPGIIDPALFDPVGAVSFRIERKDPVVTAGSCFAQHVAKRLVASGFNFLVTEKAHPIIPPAVAAAHHYGSFSARYGNVYTARQLKQLLQRAYGEFEPLERAWPSRAGTFVDPFRPRIEPRGFVSEAEVLANRSIHLAAVREAIEGMAAFVFTLGLTEAWVDRQDGAVFPLAPGVAGGSFDDSLFEFRNFNVAEVTDDMQWSIDFIRSKNPNVKVILTVSPVPLNATALDRHVFVSTTYSKAVLRVAAEALAGSNALCDYFPSYEIITSPYSRGRYFGPDCRSIDESGVDHVMSLFFKHYGDGADHRSHEVARSSATETATTRHIADMEQMVSVLCDEELISES